VLSDCFAGLLLFGRELSDSDGTFTAIFLMASVCFAFSGEYRIGAIEAIEAIAVVFATGFALLRCGAVMAR